MDKYVKVPIFPLAKYMTPGERGQMPAPMRPVSFFFGEEEVLVDAVIECDRGVSRRVGGRGFRYVLKVSGSGGQRRHAKQSVVWYDDFLQEWFVEVPESRAPADWEEARGLKDAEDFYDE